MKGKCTYVPVSQAYSASAGYGKTQLLAERILALILDDPDNARGLLATSFSRMAAAEIYERLLDLLVSASGDGEKLEQLRSALTADVGGDFAGLDRDGVLELLENLIRWMPRINIKTVDGFFASIVRCFALELGLPGNCGIAPPQEEAAARNELIRQLMRQEDGELFVSLCREAMLGRENKQLLAAAAELLRSMEGQRRRLNDHEAWRRFEKFTPAHSGQVLDEALKICREALRDTPGFEKKLEPVLRHCAVAGADYKFTRADQNVLNCFFEVWDDFPRTKPRGFIQGWEYPDKVAEAIRILMGNARNVLLSQGGRRAAALREMLAHYQKFYEKRFWHRGKMRFSDMPRLLIDRGELEFSDLQYRLNCRMHHFLIDEFQDTSRDQWQIIKPLTEDGGDGRHSLFIVGDVKQAIYSWREGDSRLMGEAAAGMERREMRHSYRYGKDICAALNLLFEQGVARCEALPEACRSRWLDIWRPHDTALKDGRAGYFEADLMLEDAELSGIELFARLIAGKLTLLEPFQKDASVAILVRNNAEGIRLRDAIGVCAPQLREKIIWEGDETIASDPLVASLLAYLIWLQHPGDTVSELVVRSHPRLRNIVPDSEEEFVARRARLEASGLGRFLRETICELRGGEDLGADGNIRSMLAAAADFDSGISMCDAIAFGEFIRGWKKSDSAFVGKVRIMTMHHSKGMTFDVVFVALLNNKFHGNLAGADYDGFLTPEDDSWILYNPGGYGAAVPEIRRAAEWRGADGSFEELCSLYVAATRARSCCYLLLDKQSKTKEKFLDKALKKLEKSLKPQRLSQGNTGSFYLSDLVFEGMFWDKMVEDGGIEPVEDSGVALYRRAFGQERLAPRKASVAATLAELDPGEVGGTPRRMRHTPSTLAGDFRHLDFALPRSGGGAELGTAVHAFFEQVRDWDGISGQLLETLTLDTRPHYEACAANPAVRELMNQPCELWRERNFDVILDDNTLLSGCFDRVQLVRDAGGRPVSATIIDFKSNRVEPGEQLERATEHYRPQMASYRRALAGLLKLPESAIKTVLLFTRPGMLVEIK